MQEPKTKPNTPPPKTLQHNIRTSKGVKSSLSNSISKIDKTNRNFQKQMIDNQQYDKPENYATENVAEKSEYISRKVGGKTIEKIKNTVKTKANIDKSVKEQVQQNTKHNSKIRHSQSEKMKAKNAIHTGKNKGKAVKRTSKGVKNTNKAVKKAQKGVKTAAKKAKQSKRAKTAAAIAKKAAVTAAKTTKRTAKAVIAAAKATVTAIRGMIAAISAGGWVAVVIIIIIAVIIAIASSPLAVLSNDTDGTTPTISQVVQEINGGYANTISNIIANAGEIDELIIEGEFSSSEFYVSNWIDVIGVFTVKSTITSGEEEYIPIVYMDDRQIKDLKKIFWDMNSITYELIEEEIEPVPTPTPMPSVSPTPSPTISDSPTPEPTPKIYRTLVITTVSKTYIDGAEIYSFSDKQIQVLNELMTPQYMPLFMEICGMDSYIGLTPEQMANLINNLPKGELGSVIIEYALSRLGDPYSQSMRGQGTYVDCSYFARWCYQQAGASHFTAGTAAEQARYCVNNGLCISYSNLQPGDLIFWSYNVNGRFMNIGHVGIYAGNGYVIDASSSRGMVVYRPVFGENNIVACARPHVLN